MENDGLKNLAQKLGIWRLHIVTIQLKEMYGASEAGTFVPLLESMVASNARGQTCRQAYDIFFMIIGPKISRPRTRTFQEADVSQKMRFWRVRSGYDYSVERDDDVYRKPAWLIGQGRR